MCVCVCVCVAVVVVFKETFVVIPLGIATELPGSLFLGKSPCKPWGQQSQHAHRFKMVAWVNDVDVPVSSSVRVYAVYWVVHLRTHPCQSF